MRGQHKPGYVRPRKGEKRQQDKPLKVDRLPAEVRDAIQKARAASRTWAETTEAAAKAAAKLGVKPPSEGAVRRWYDQRIEQVQKEVMAQAERARALAAAFAQRGFKELPEAALAALSSEVFTVMEAGTPGAREASLSNLVFMLSKLMTAQAAHGKLELEKEKLDVRREAMQATSPREIYLAAVEELLKKLRTRKAVREVLDPIAKELIEELSKSAESFTKRIEAQQA